VAIHDYLDAVVMQNSIFRVYCMTFFAIIVPCLIGCAEQALRAQSSSRGAADPHAKDAFEAMNRYRASQGKPALVRHSGLDALAREHSRYLLQHRGSFGLHGTNISHFAMDNRVLAARRLYGMDTLSENVTVVDLTNRPHGNDLFAMWKRSKGHHRNLLDSWTYTGIGTVKEGETTLYCTQIFASPAIGHQPLRDLMINRY
jgi:uncharacterized protein YkwD